MYERIVVPLDGSAPAEQALPEAVELARLTAAPLHLVRVVDAAHAEGAGPSELAIEHVVAVGEAKEGAPTAEETAARAYIAGVQGRLSGTDEAADRLVDEASEASFPASDPPAWASGRRHDAARGVVATTELRRGTIARELLAAIRPGDLVVMASQGWVGPASRFPGRVTEEVIRHASVPVLLVPAAEPATIGAGLAG